jgi:enoyl-[acyl-carrier protein] reductase II
MTSASGRLCQLVGIDRPIFQAAMGYVSTGRLASAVSQAGGLGVIATGGLMDPDELRGHIGRVRDEAGSRPFGVNVLLPSGATDESAFGNRRLLREHLDVCIEERVPVVLSGLGDPSSVINELHGAGLLFIGVVGSTRAARKVALAGADAVVAQGHEAGGHVGPTGTMSLAQSVLREFDIPVLLAGGIATGEAVGGAVALGAAGVSVGTRFLASQESDAHETYKRAVVAAGESSTLVTRACTGKPSRALRNAFTESWEGRDDEVGPGVTQADAEIWRARVGAVDGDVVDGFLPMGQVAAVIDEVLPAAEIVDLLAAGVEVTA